MALEQLLRVQEKELRLIDRVLQIDLQGKRQVQKRIDLQAQIELHQVAQRHLHQEAVIVEAAIPHLDHLDHRCHLAVVRQEAVEALLVVEAHAHQEDNKYKNTFHLLTWKVFPYIVLHK